MKATKSKTLFACSQCGHEEPRWLGRCPSCGEWNTLMPETAVSAKAERRGPGASTEGASGGQRQGAVALEAVDPARSERILTGLPELDRVLGGGLTKGATVLIGGEPGIGKSTLLLQCASLLGRTCRVLYISGEESPPQIRVRSERLGLALKGLHVLGDTELTRILSVLDSFNPEIVVVDSIQTLYAAELGAVPGTVNQLRMCCHEISDWARLREASVLYIAHVTKEGVIAGPKLIEHLVDTVAYFEQSEGDLRFLRVTKNRFGSVDELGLFAMREQGLVQVLDPSSLFLVERGGDIPPGVVTAPVYEGSRILLVEIQSLTVPAKGGISRIFSDRIDTGRVSRIAAVLEKHLGLRFSDQDVYVNVAGGMRLTEVGTELPLAVALYSARTGITVPGDFVVTGEVTLAGEVRPVPHLGRRLKTALELGFERLVGPARTREDEEGPEAWIKVSTLPQAVEAVFGTKSNKQGIDKE